jgi:twitching motility protein PilI
MLQTLRNSTEIIALLQQMERYNQDHASPLPQEEEVKSIWSGVGIRIGKYHFVAALGYVCEIMKYPRLSLLPGSKSWTLGIANVRGNLLPIFDIHGFLGNVSTPLKRETRVLSISGSDFSAGLLVDEVFGMKYFDKDNYDASLTYDVKWKNYLNGGYQLDGQKWIIFNMQYLLENENFLHVAI